jgi:CBS-domain-containing membrane protein
MERVVLPGRAPAATPITAVMTSPVTLVSGDISVAEGATIMRAHHIRHLGVLDGDGRFAGLVGLRYLLYDLLSALEVKVEGLEGYIMADGIGG